jgi:hypothetical protein
MIASDFNPASFQIVNVVDTCAVWNLVSSPTLYNSAQAAGLKACVTGFVQYEALVKRRTSPTAEDAELVARATTAISNREITVHPLDIEDLQDVEVLRARKALGRGELSTIVFAKKVNIAMMSDDRKATIFAAQVLESKSRATTTPKLLGWLLFYSLLSISDVEAVVEEHQAMCRPLENHFRRMVEIIEGYMQVDRGIGGGLKPI